MTTLVATGLTDAEVAQRVAEGMTNDVPTRAARSVVDITRANVFTRINAILGVLLVIVLATGSVINGLFGLLIIANSLIGMVQEIRAKQTLDKLAIVGQAKPLVRRRSGTRTLLPLRDPLRRGDARALRSHRRALDRDAGTALRRIRGAAGRRGRPGVAVLPGPAAAPPLGKARRGGSGRRRGTPLRTPVRF